MEQKAQKVADILKVIANKNRLMILCILEDGMHTVSEIHEQITDISLPAISQHLSSLKLAGIVASEKKGMHVYYQIRDQRMVKVMNALKEMYCND